jgi:hypothetical protein
MITYSLLYAKLCKKSKDRKWVEEKINEIFPKDNEEHWKNSFSSYLFYSSILSRKIYSSLKVNNHYNKALNIGLNQRISERKLAQHVSIAYLNDFEGLSRDGLLFKLISNQNPEYLENLILFIWRLRDKLTADMRNKITPLWENIMDFLNEASTNGKYRKTFAILGYWMSLIDELDEEICGWLIKSGRYIDDTDDIFYVDYLLMHVIKTPKLAGNVFYNIINDGHFSRLKREKIVEIIENLYNSGEVTLANIICVLYLDAGFDFLRKVYTRAKS